MPRVARGAAASATLGFRREGVAMSKMTALRPDDKEWYLDFIRGAIDLDRSDIDTSAANRLVLVQRARNSSVVFLAL